MKLADMLTYWQMKGMISDRKAISEFDVYNSDVKLRVCSCKITGKEYSGEHARITYRMEGVKIALIYADIFFTGFAEYEPDQVFIKNAKISDLANRFVLP